MESFTHVVTALPQPLAYGLVALAVFVEAGLFVGFVVPGETLVLLGGLLAGTGRLSLGLLAGIVVVAAVLGDTLGYEIGRHAGPRIVNARLLRRHRRRVVAVQTLLRKRGGGAVLLGRFTAFARAVMPALAGAARMPYRRFIVFNATGAVLWGVGMSALGFVAGHSLARVEHVVGTVGVVLLIALVGAAAWLLRRYGRQVRRRV